MPHQLLQVIHMGAVRSRVETIDAMRVLAMFAVIQIHTPWHGGTDGLPLDTATLLDQIARFAVPFFFVISGYFWSAGSTVTGDYWARSVTISKRALLVFLFWSLLYGIDNSVKIIRHDGVSILFKVVVSIVYPLHPLGFVNSVLQGTKYHLWFLPALAIAALISGALLSRRRECMLFVLAVALFVVGLAGSAYAGSPFGFTANFNFRNGPFFSLIMFVSGHAIQRYGQGLSLLPLGIAMAIGGFVLQHIESTWIHQQWVSRLTHDYVAGTYFFGLGISMIALSNTRFLRIKSLVSIGPLALGVYASHCFFVDRMHWLEYAVPGPTLRQAAYVAIVFMLALSTSFILAQWHRTRPFVT
jgi:surface polysaccharide O-acyltransferase-like enzyme